MILNLLMFFGSFMVAKNTRGRLLAAAGIGIVKGAVYFQATNSVWLGALMGLVFFSLILGIIACLTYLNRPIPVVPVYPLPWERDTRPFQWIYVPLSFLVFTVLFGETTVFFFLPS
jgi:hypothetical protein